MAFCCGLESSDSRYATVAEFLGSIKDGNFDWLNDYQHNKHDSAPWNSAKITAALKSPKY
jgi:hypothetical protein